MSFLRYTSEQTDKQTKRHTDSLIQAGRNTSPPSPPIGGEVISRHIIVVANPFPSNRHHRSNGDCLEGKRKNYQVCSVQYCAQQLCTVQYEHMNRPNSFLDWVLSHWAHFTVRRFIFVCVLLCEHCMHVYCVVW